MGQPVRHMAADQQARLCRFIIACNLRVSASQAWYHWRTLLGSRYATWPPTNRQVGTRLSGVDSELCQVLVTEGAAATSASCRQHTTRWHELGSNAHAWVPFLSMQVCGTAQYVDDIKLPPGALHGALILCSRPHARILHIDTAAAAAMPGVHGIYTGGWSQGHWAVEAGGCFTSTQRLLQQPCRACTARTRVGGRSTLGGRADTARGCCMLARR